MLKYKGKKNKIKYVWNTVALKNKKVKFIIKQWKLKTNHKNLKQIGKQNYNIKHKLLKETGSSFNIWKNKKEECHVAVYLQTRNWTELVRPDLMFRWTP